MQHSLEAYILGPYGGRCFGKREPAVLGTIIELSLVVTKYTFALGQTASINNYSTDFNKSPSMLQQLN